MTPVLTKPDFYRRWQANEFGNRLGSWDSIAAAEADGFAGPTFGIRSTIPQWPHFEAYLPWKDRHKHVARKLQESGTPLELLRIVEDDYGNHRAIQGHLWWPRSDQFVLEYSLGQGTLRAEHDKGLTFVRGLQAREILRARLDPCDYESLLELQELYPEHVIEFTSYRKPVGLLRRCMVIWEVRLY